MPNYQRRARRFLSLYIAQQLSFRGGQFLPIDFRDLMKVQKDRMNQSWDCFCEALGGWSIEIRLQAREAYRGECLRRGLIYMAAHS